MGRAPCCDKTNVKRGPWSPEEDATLTSYLERHGTGGNWIALPHKAGLRRCGKSCRLRWLNYLRPDIKHGCFTQHEDNIICTLYNNIGSRWSVIASHLPGRTDNDVKNHWNTKLKKKLQFVQHFTTTTTQEEITSSSSRSAAPTTLPPALPPLPKVKSSDQAAASFYTSTTPNLFSTAGGMEFSSYDYDHELLSSELPAVAAPFPILMQSMIQLPPQLTCTTLGNTNVSPPEDGYSSSRTSSSTSADHNKINWPSAANSINIATTGGGIGDGDMFLQDYLGFGDLFLGGFGENVAPPLFYSSSSSSSTKPQAAGLYQNHVTYSHTS